MAWATGSRGGYSTHKVVGVCHAKNAKGGLWNGLIVKRTVFGTANSLRNQGENGGLWNGAGLRGSVYALKCSSMERDMHALARRSGRCAAPAPMREVWSGGFAALFGASVRACEAILNGAERPERGQNDEN